MIFIKKVLWFPEIGYGSQIKAYFVSLLELPTNFSIQFHFFNSDGSLYSQQFPVRRENLVFGRVGKAGLPLQIINSFCNYFSCL